MKHECPLCKKWVPKIHIGNHMRSCDEKLNKAPTLSYTYNVRKAFYDWKDKFLAVVQKKYTNQ